jgi:hypothetical protein
MVLYFCNKFYKDEEINHTRTIMAIVACSSNDASETSIDGNNYNKTALLLNWADNIIIKLC